MGGTGFVLIPFCMFSEKNNSRAKQIYNLKPDSPVQCGRLMCLSQNPKPL